MPLLPSDNPTSPVRIARRADENALFALLVALSEDNPLGLPWDEDAVRAHIRLGTEGKGGLHGVIDGRNGELAGSVGIILSSFWFSSRERFLSQLWCFVRPEYRRGTGYGDALRRWARERHAEFESALGRPIPFDFSVMSRRRLPDKIRWFGRGAIQIGAVFLVNRT